MSTDTRTDIVRDKEAFRTQEGEYLFIATYLQEPKGEALVEVFRGDERVRSFLWPAYKVWNIAAHASEIAADMDIGLANAGSDLLGGCVAPKDVDAEPNPEEPTP